MFFATLLALATTALAAPSSSQSYHRKQSGANKCPILLDGRVPANTPLSTFDTTASPFNPTYTKSTTPWSQILEEPKGLPASRFDINLSIPIEVTIDNSSIFQGQYGFRRAGLQFATDSGSGASDQGVVTVHWSVRQDPQKPLNLTHEYLNFWHETSDYSANQFNFNTGTKIGTSGANKSTWQLLDRNTNLLWSTPISSTSWQNFAVTLDYNQNTLTVYTSLNSSPLVKAGGPYSNDNSGGGQFQFGILKKPTGNVADIVHEGIQEAPFSEGQIYGGVFVENSANGCISL